jgi:hypothetical protein
MASQKYNDIRLGVVDFLDPTLLLLGEVESFKWIADEINKKHSIVLENSIKNGVSLKFIFSVQGGELHEDGHAFEWELSPAEATVVASQLRELADSKRLAHAYLDPLRNNTGIQIVASIGEYDGALIFSEK